MNNPYDSQPPEQPTEDFAPTPGTVTGVGTLVIKKRGFWARAWHGEEKLSVVFWIYGVVLSIGFGVLLFFLAMPLYAISLVVPAYALIPKAIMLPYTVWILVSVWRCAWNVNTKFWGYVARVIVVLAVLGNIYSVIRILTADPVLNATKQASGSYKITLPDSTNTQDGSSQIAPIAEVQPSSAPVTPTSPATPEAITPPVPANDALPSVSQEAIEGAKANPCVQRLVYFAVNDRVDYKIYIEENQAYLQKCKQAASVPPLPPLTSPELRPSDGPEGSSRAKEAARSNPCSSKMAYHAVLHNADPNIYITQNQAFLMRCQQALALPSAAPTTSGVAAPAATPDVCEQKMHDFAVQNKADPKAYIAQNQTYLAQCRAALAGQAKP